MAELTCRVTATNAHGSSDPVTSAPAVITSGDVDLPVSGTNEVLSLWVGAVTEDSITATARTDDLTDETILVASTDENFAGQVHSDPLTPDGTYYFCRGTITGLQPGTSYYLGVAVDGTIDSTRVGRFRTPPEGVHSFSFGFLSCVQTGSTQQIFNNISRMAEEGDIEFVMHLGDLHYDDNDSSNVALWHQSFDTVFASARQNACWRSMPIYYMWDDHDFGPDASFGYNQPGGTPTTYRDPAVSAYRARVPSPPLVVTASGGATYYSFVRGRLRFIVTDLRADSAKAGTNGSVDANEPTKTKLGAAQKQWLKDEMIAARDGGQGICWANTLPWWVDLRDDSTRWGSYLFEVGDIADFIVNEGLSDSIFQISGDMHAQAFVSAATNTKGSFPICQGAPGDQNSSHKLTSYTIGPFPDSTGIATSQVGVIEITDSGGGTIGVRFRGIGISRGTGTSLDDYGTETELLDTSFTLTVSGGAIETDIDAGDGELIVNSLADVDPLVITAGDGELIVEEA